MHFSWQNLGKWAIYGVALAICCGYASPALAQKFARRARPVSSSKIVSATESDSEVTSVQIESAPTRVYSGQVPDWQRSPAPGRQYRAMPSRNGRRQTTMQEISVMQQPTPADPELVAPGMLEGEPSEGEVIQGGPVVDGYAEDMFMDGGAGGCSTCGGDPLFDDHVCGPDCDQTNCPRLRPCDGICIPRHRVEEHSLFIGPQAFRGPLDLGRSNNFGFHEGVNFAGQFGRRLGFGHLGIGYQIGALFTQSNFYGNQVNGLETKERDQQFITAGLFRRARGRGYQGGAVFDYLHDNYYVKYNVGQVRAELSYLTPCGHEFGFFGAFHVRPGRGAQANTALGTLFTQQFSTIDYYNLFYRYNLPNGSWGRVWGGGTANANGMIGADFRMPMTNKWDLSGMFNFLVPGGGGGIVAQNKEAWGLSLNLTWYWGRTRSGVHNGYYRSLFNVANNGLMFVKPTGP
ncbi:MAG TPA: DUF6666 family protein [Pirellulales bacterium]|nr:DUF6666 family protein [Pirellulales bacterium]